MHVFFFLKVLKQKLFKSIRRQLREAEVEEASFP